MESVVILQIFIGITAVSHGQPLLFNSCRFESSSTSSPASFRHCDLTKESGVLNETALDELSPLPGECFCKAAGRFAGRCYWEEPYYPFVAIITVQSAQLSDYQSQSNISLEHHLKEFSRSVSTCGDAIIWLVSPDVGQIIRYQGSLRGWKRHSLTLTENITDINFELFSDIKRVESKLSKLVNTIGWTTNNFPTTDNIFEDNSLCGPTQIREAKREYPWLCDPDGYLNQTEHQVLERKLSQIPWKYECFCERVNCTYLRGGNYTPGVGPKVAVVIVSSVAPAAAKVKGDSGSRSSNTMSHLRRMADELRTRNTCDIQNKVWAGKHFRYTRCDDMALVLLSVEDRKLFVSLGESMERKFTPHFSVRLGELVPVHVTSRSVFQAVHNTILVIEESIVAYEEDKRNYMFFIQILLIVLVVLTPFACLLGLAFTK